VGAIGLIVCDALVDLDEEVQDAAGLEGRHKGAQDAELGALRVDLCGVGVEGGGAEVCVHACTQLTTRGFELSIHTPPLTFIMTTTSDSSSPMSVMGSTTGTSTVALPPSNCEKWR
jgi:hypothetical protein